MPLTPPVNATIEELLNRYQAASAPVPLAPVQELAGQPLPAPATAPTAQELAGQVLDQRYAQAPAPATPGMVSDASIAQPSQPFGTKLSPEEESRFQADMTSKPGYKDWYNEASTNWGHAPDFNDPENDYDYRGAWKNGIVPAPYEHDGGKYHWASSTNDGTMLKSENHPTAWMEHFMRATGKDPNEVGVQSEAEGRAYMEANPEVRPGSNGLTQESITTKSVRPASDFKGALQELDQANTEAEKATTDFYDAQSKGLTARGKIQAQQAAEAEVTAKADKAMADAYQAERAQGMRQYESLQKEADDAEVKDSRTTGMKVANTFALAFAGLGDAFARLGGDRGTNYSGNLVKLINENVDRDLAQQREAKGDKQKKADRRLQQLDRAQTFFKDDKLASDWYKAQRQEHYANALDQQASESGSDTKKAEGQKAAAYLRQDSKEKKAALLERWEEQQMRSKLVKGAGGKGGAGINYDPDAIAAKKANGGQLNKDEARILQAHQNANSAQDRFNVAQEAKRLAWENKPDTEKQAIARALHESSAKPAAYLQLFLDGKKELPSSLLTKVGLNKLSPDVIDRESALFNQAIEAAGNDVLRFESGAAISTTETEQLVAKARSTDPVVAKAAVERLLDKRNAMRGIFANKPHSQAPAGSVKPDGGESRATPKPVPEGKVRVRRKSDGNTGLLDANSPAIKSGKYEVL